MLHSVLTTDLVDGKTRNIQSMQRLKSVRRGLANNQIPEYLSSRTHVHCLEIVQIVN